MRVASLVLCFLLSTATQSSAAITGSVFSESGQPLAGANVTIRRAAAYTERQAIALGLRAAPPALGEAVTRDDGTFAVDANVAGAFVISVRADGYAPASLLTVAEDDLISLTLKDAPDKTGRVTAAGRPVAGAVIVADDGFGSTLVARTGTDGTFVMPDPAAWARTITILHPAYAVLPAQPQGAADLSFSLSKGGAFPASISLANGKPATDVTFTAAGVPIARRHGETMTTLAAPPSDGSLVVTSGGESAVAAKGAQKITLSAPVTISGVIRDEKRRPVAWLPVSAWPSGARHTRAPITLSTIADESGRFTIAATSPGQYGVWAAPLPTLTFASAQADLRKARTASVDLEARRMSQIAGKVSDAEGAPVRGAAVSMLPDAFPVIYAHLTSRGWMNSSISAAGGRFRISYGSDDSPEIDGEDSMKVRVVASKPGYAAAVSEVFDLAKLPKSVDLKLDRGVALTGIVQFEDGKPAANVDVIAAETSAAMNAPISSALQSKQATAWIRTDSEGRFTIHVRKKAHILGAWKEGFAAANARVGDSWDESTPLRLVLEKGSELSGRVTRAGEGVTSGQVMATSGDGTATLMTSVGLDGSFRFSGLAKGPYRLTFNDGQAMAETMAAAPASGVKIELPRLLSIRGRVVDTHGNPVRAFAIEARSEVAWQENREDVESDDGTFTLPSLPAGETALTVTAPGYSAAREQLIVSADSPPVTITLAPGRTIRGVVTDEAGMPVAEATIVVSGDARIFVHADGKGEFEIENAPVTALKLELSADGFVDNDTTVEAGPVNLQLNLKLERGVTLTGRVVNESGAAVPGVSVAANPVGHSGGWESTESDRDGAFTISGLSAGRYRLQAKRGASAGTVEVTAPVTDPIVIALAAQASGTIEGTIKGLPASALGRITVFARSGDNQRFGNLTDEGRFRIEDVPAGEANVSAMIIEQARERSTRAVKVTVVAGQTAEVTLSAEGGSVVRGTVRTNGVPAVGANVSLSTPSDYMLRWRSVADENGSFSIEGVPRGDYELAVQSLRTRKQLEISVTRDVETVDLSIAEVSIRGRVVDAKGNGLGKTAVSVLGNDRGDTTESATNGEFVLQTTADLPVKLAFAKSRYATVIRTIDAATAASPLAVTLSETGGLTVRLVDTRTGSSVKGYTAVRDTEGTEIPAAREELPDGTVLLSLPAGQYRISASAEGLASRTVPATVPAAQPLAIPLAPGGKLIVIAGDEATGLVKLLAPNGEEYVRCYCNGIATVRLTGQETTIDHVAAGDYLLQVLDANGRLKATQPVTIVENGTTRAELRID